MRISYGPFTATKINPGQSTLPGLLQVVASTVGSCDPGGVGVSGDGGCRPDWAVVLYVHCALPAPCDRHHTSSGLWPSLCTANGCLAPAAPAHDGMSERQENMDKITLFGFLIVATSLEAVGDAVVRLGINQSAWMLRGPLFAAGAVLLFGYGLSVNLAPVEFGRVAGLYIATLFVVWQLVNWIVFRSPPVAPILVGGALIVAGGAIVTFWKMTMAGAAP
jgi:hypothetical protein